MRDFVGDSGSADGLDKCYLTSGCKKKTKFSGTTVFFVFSGGTVLGSLGFKPSPLLLKFNLKGLPIGLTLSVSAVLASCLCLWIGWNHRRDGYEITGKLFNNSLQDPNKSSKLLIIADISLPVRDTIPSLICTPPRENLSGFTGGAFPYNSSQRETHGVSILPLDQWETDPSQVITLSILPGR